MSDRIRNISQLRRLLAERFPRQRLGSPCTPPPAGGCKPTGVSGLDALLKGGLPPGAITELVASNPASGSSLVLLRLIESVQGSGEWLVLVDGHDSFDPSPLADAALSCLLWVRCRDAAAAMRAADFLLRDDNMPLVILDLRLNPANQLRRISSSQWYRLQRLTKQRSCALLVITPFAMVGSAQFRLALQSRFRLADLARGADELVSELKFEQLRSHGVEPGRREMAAETG